MFLTQPEKDKPEIFTNSVGEKLWRKSAAI